MAGIALGEMLPHTLTKALSIPAGLLPLLASAVLLAKPCRRRPALVSAALAVAALGLGWLRHQAAIDLPANHIGHLLEDKPVLTRLTGQLLTAPVTHAGEKRNPYSPFEPPPRTRFILAAHEVHTQEAAVTVSGAVQVTVEGQPPAVEQGNHVEIIGRLYRQRGPQNPAATDWAALYRLQGIHAGLSVEGPQYVTRLQPISGLHHRFLIALRRYAAGLLLEPEATGDDEEAKNLLDAMVLGQRSAVGRRINEAFLRTGTIHFLSVSGAHVGLLAWAAWWTVRGLLRRGPRAAAVTTLAFILLYAALAEPNAPILRATIMGVLFCLATLTNRPFSVLNWLALSVLCILAYAPLELFRPSFQLSFVQVLALAMVVPPLFRLVFFRAAGQIPPDADTWPALVRRWIWRLATRGLGGVALVSGVAWLVALPLTLFHFGYFTPLGAVQSIFLALPISFTILLAFVTALFSAVLPPVGAGLESALEWTTNALLFLVERLAQMPGTLIQAQPPPAWLVFATYGLALAAVRLWSARRGKRERPVPPQIVQTLREPSWPRWLAGCVAAAVPILWLGWLGGSLGSIGDADAEHGRGEYAVHVLAVGNGSATLILTPTGEAALLDLGTTANWDTGEMAAAACRTLGVRRLAWLSVSHADFDHFSGVPRLLEDVPADRIFMGPHFPADRQSDAAKFLRDLPPHAPRPEIVAAGGRLPLGPTIAEVLWPPAGLGTGPPLKDNDQSLVLRLALGPANAAAPDERPPPAVLVPGDIEREALRKLLALAEDGRLDLRAEVLIAPHHGSVGGSPAARRETARFYRAVAPRWVIVSTARDCAKLRELVHETLGADCQVLSTGEAGAVRVRVGANGELQVETPFAGRKGD